MFKVTLVLMQFAVNGAGNPEFIDRETLMEFDTLVECNEALNEDFTDLLFDDRMIIHLCELS